MNNKFLGSYKATLARVVIGFAIVASIIIIFDTKDTGRSARDFVSVEGNEDWRATLDRVIAQDIKVSYIVPAQPIADAPYGPVNNPKYSVGGRFLYQSKCKPESDNCRGEILDRETNKSFSILMIPDSAWVDGYFVGFMSGNFIGGVGGLYVIPTNVLETRWEELENMESYRRSNEFRVFSSATDYDRYSDTVFEKDKIFFTVRSIYADSEIRYEYDVSTGVVTTVN